MFTEIFDLRTALKGPRKIEQQISNILHTTRGQIYKREGLGSRQNKEASERKGEGEARSQLIFRSTSQPQSYEKELSKKGGRENETWKLAFPGVYRARRWFCCARVLNRSRQQKKRHRSSPISPRNRIIWPIL